MFLIRLEPFSKQDFDLLISWVDSPEFLMQWGGTDVSYPLDEKQLNQYIKGANEECSRVYI